MRSLAFLIPIGLASLVAAQAYVLEGDYEPASFFDMFDFFTSADPTNGYVSYVDRATAQTSGLISNNNGSIYMGVDSTNISPASGHPSVRVSSKKTYNHGLNILDFAHMPGGICGTWPASWMTGPNWPINGEIDIIEDVNSATVNGMTLHTDAGCSVSMLQSGPALRSLSTPSPEMPFQQTSPAAIPIQVGLFDVGLTAYRIHEHRFIHHFDFVHHFGLIHGGLSVHRFPHFDDICVFYNIRHNHHLRDLDPFHDFFLEHHFLPLPDECLICNFIQLVLAWHQHSTKQLVDRFEYMVGTTVYLANLTTICVVNNMGHTLASALQSCGNLCSLFRIRQPMERRCTRNAVLLG